MSTDGDEALHSWDLLRGAGLVRVYGADEVVFRQGDPADGAYVVLAGHFTVHEGDDEVAVLDPGELFGEIGALGGGARSATVRSRGPGELLFLSLAELRAGFSASPDLLWGALRLIVRRMRTIAARQVAYRDEHKALREVQRSLLPDPASLGEGLGFAVEGAWEPATYASGDFFDAVPVEGHRTLFVIGDVMGHGAMSSLMMGVARAQVRELARAFRRTDELLLRLDGYLRDNAPPRQGMSLAVAVLDPGEQSLEYSSAGHPMPLLARAGDVSPLPGRGGILLALPFMMGRGYERFETGVEPGDRLLMFTDGLVEVGVAGGGQLGVEGLAALVRDLATTVTGPGLLDALFARVAAADLADVPDDDRTALLVTIDG